jgi:hypothetical protein
MHVILTRPAALHHQCVTGNAVPEGSLESVGDGARFQSASFAFSTAPAGGCIGIVCSDEGSLGPQDGFKSGIHSLSSPCMVVLCPHVVEHMAFCGARLVGTADA